jgi:hypothetical protein
MISDRVLIDVRARIGAVAQIRGPRRKSDYRKKGGRGWTGDPVWIDDRTPRPAVRRRERSLYASFDLRVGADGNRRADHSFRVRGAGSFAQSWLYRSDHDRRRRGLRESKAGLPFPQELFMQTTTSSALQTVAPDSEANVTDTLSYSSDAQTSVTEGQIAVDQPWSVIIEIEQSTEASLTGDAIVVEIPQTMTVVVPRQTEPTHTGSYWSRR